MTVFQAELPRDSVRASTRIAAAIAVPTSASEIQAIQDRASALRARTIAAGVKTAFAKLGRLLDAHAQRTQEVATLNRMTDRQLADVGLTRADVWRLAH